MFLAENEKVKNCTPFVQCTNLPNCKMQQILLLIKGFSY